jgi:hypothetical protein
MISIDKKELSGIDGGPDPGRLAITIRIERALERNWPAKLGLTAVSRS